MRKIPKRSKSKNTQNNNQGYFDENKYKNTSIKKDLQENLSVMRHAFKNCYDVKFRQINIGKDNIKAVLIYIDGIVDKALLSQGILDPLVVETQKIEIGKLKLKDSTDYIKESLLINSEIDNVNIIGQAVDNILTGNTVLFIDGFETAIKIAVEKWESRDIGLPQSERTIKGPQEAFTELAKTNISILRRRIRSPNLKTEKKTIGRITETDTIICYLADVVNEQILDEVKRRLEKIDVDSIQASSFLEELIEDSPFSPFPQILRSERPDVVEGALLEGRVAIIVEGTPFSIMVPVTFMDFLTSSEDYFERYYYTSAIKLLRILFYFISLLAPSLYIAFTTYHQEMIPVTLLTSIAQSRAGVPFPAFIEALIMEVTFEALREAGVRLPKAVGQAVTIVGALVIGEAAVQAGLVSNAMVIVVAITGIASFTIPFYAQGLAARLLRFPIIILAASLGLFGIIFALTLLLIHLSSLRNFGVPYLSPFAPLTVTDLKNSIIRLPEWSNRKRPTFIAKRNVIKKAKNLKPGRDKNEE